MIEVGRVYRLYAHWHSRHGKDVLVVMKRTGVSEAYAGREVYHIVADPYCTSAIDLDTEFVEENFRVSGQWTFIKKVIDTPAYWESVFTTDKTTGIVSDDRNRILYPVAYEEVWKGRETLTICYYISKENSMELDFGDGCLPLHYLINILSFYNQDGTLKEIEDVK